MLSHFNPKLRTVIHVDGSQRAVGAVLLQWEEGEIYPRSVCFLSMKLSGPQYRYDSGSVESLTVQVALSKWRQYLYDIQFEIFTDHQRLQISIHTTPSPTGREFEVKVGNMARDNGLCVCVVKPHGVSDKPLGEAILHGSGGRRMTADILAFRRRIEWRVF